MSNYTKDEAKEKIKHAFKYPLPQDILVLFDELSENFTFNEDNFKNLIKIMRSLVKQENGLQKIKYRLQATVLYPFMMQVMIGSANGHLSIDSLPNNRRGARKFWKQIENGGSLTKALLDFCHDEKLGNIEEKHLKTVRKYKLDIKPREINTLAGFLNVDLFPKNNSELSLINIFILTLQNSTIVLETDYIARRNIQKRLAKTVLEDFNRASYKTMEQKNEILNFRHTRDVIKALIENMISVIRGESTETFTRKMMLKSFEQTCDILSQLTVKELFDLNIDYHNQWTMISEKMRQYEEDNGRKLINEWAEKYPKATSETIPALGDLTIIPLTSRNQLVEEHKRMDHCIDTYAVSNIFGNSVVFSVRDKSGNSLSTFELDKNDKLIQHQAKKNTEPKEDEVEAVRVYIKAIETRMITQSPVYTEWLKKADNLTDMEVYGFDKGIPEYKRAVAFFHALFDQKVLPKKMIKALSAFNIEKTNYPNNQFFENPNP